MRIIRIVSFFLVVLLIANALPVYALNNVDYSAFNFSIRMIRSVNHEKHHNDLQEYFIYYMDLDNNIAVYVNKTYRNESIIHDNKMYMLKTNEDGYISLINYSGSSLDIYFKEKGFLVKQLVAYEKKDGEYKKMMSWHEEKIEKQPPRDLKTIGFYDVYHSPTVIQNMFKNKGLLD